MLSFISYSLIIFLQSYYYFLMNPSLCSPSSQNFFVRNMSSQKKEKKKKINKRYLLKMYTLFFSHFTFANPPIFSQACNSKHMLRSSRYDRGDRSYDRGYDRYDRPQYHDRYDRYDRAYDKYDRYDRSRSRSYSPRKSPHQVFCLGRVSLILSRWSPCYLGQVCDLGCSLDR